MNPDTSDDDSGPTRRQTMRATLAGAAAITVGTGAVSAKDCDVTEEDRRRVREEWADATRLQETLASQKDVVNALRKNGFVEGRDDAVLVYAEVVDCEVVPEYRILRRTAAGGHLTVSLRAISGTGYVAHNPLDPEHHCEPILNNCFDSCYSDPCCSCEFGFCGCEGAQVPCDPYCCYKCECACNDFECIFHCDTWEPDPDPVPVPVDWYEKVVG